MVVFTTMLVLCAPGSIVSIIYKMKGWRNDPDWAAFSLHAAGCILAIIAVLVVLMSARWLLS